MIRRFIFVGVACFILLFHSRSFASSEYSIDVVGGPTDFVHVETQWPIVKLSERSSIAGYLGGYAIKDELQYLPILGVLIGYKNREFGTDVIWLEFDAAFGGAIGGYSNALGDGFYLKSGIAIMMNWLLPIQYGISYQYQMSMMSAKNNDSLSKNASVMALVFRVPINKNWFFPEVIPMPPKEFDDI